ncbi:MAG: zf-TFIIB domain-containing protein [Bacteroidetes bacterium]|nr:zf-TFIIB domain-containing protein [Bacteroidota bacterium]
MKCPNCNETLLMTERNSIAIDYCPSCRGVWLDKGELDKMLDFAAKNSNPYPYPNQTYDDNTGYQPNKQNFQQGRQRPNKKRSFLGDLFEFD